jgi:hypothetical protein
VTVLPPTARPPRRARTPGSLLRAVTAAVALACLAALGAAAPAGAAAPDAVGFVLWDGAATVPARTFPAATTVLTGLPGQYRVIFPGMAARGGVVHVTAVNQDPYWCQADGWGPSGADQVVGISCYKAGGGLAPSAFTAMFESSSGTVVPAAQGRFGYVDATATGALVDQYNSAGAVNTVTHAGVGRWLVRLPGLTTPGPIDGSLQATAVSPNVGARCKIGRWRSSPAGGQQVLVLCFDAAGAPYDTRFTMSFQYERSLFAAAFPPKLFGYLWNAPPVGPVSTNFDSITGPGTVTLMPAGPGLSLITFPKLAGPPDTVQVTAAGVGSEFCGLLTTWFHIGGDTVVRDVNCWTNAGGRVDTGFLVSANSIR